MRRRLPHAAIAAVALGAAAAASAHAAEGAIRPKPAEIGTADAPGEVRRIIHPFGDWTLVCDENLKKKQKICNVSQSFVNGDGATVFSWSLAATRGGTPVLILRARNDGSQEARTVKVAMAGLRAPQSVWLSTCDSAICVGYHEVGAEFGRKLRGGGEAEVTVTYAGKPTVVASELKNLNAALAALK